MLKGGFVRKRSYLPVLQELILHDNKRKSSLAIFTQSLQK